MLSCRLLGHRPAFRAHGQMMVWECERGCGEGGSKTYPTADQAERYARAFDKRDTDDLGRRAPLIGLFPLRLWRRFARGPAPTRGGQSSSGRASRDPADRREDQ